LSSATSNAILPTTSLAIGDSNFQPFFLEYALMAEYNMIQKEKIPGVYVMPSAKSALVWNGVMFVRQGIYQDGIFRFTVNIPANFPDCDCPSITFTPPVYHPVIDPSTGSLDIIRAFHKWRRSVNHLWQILLYARRVFFKIDTKEPLNPEAADLYVNSPDVFRQRVTECIVQCRETLYNDPDPTDAHAIRFSVWDDAVHGPAKQQMFSVKNDNNSSVAAASGLKSGFVSPPDESFLSVVARKNCGLTMTDGVRNLPLS
jgi:ubiquitin-protein ligase